MKKHVHEWTIEGPDVSDVFIERWNGSELETITKEEAELRLNEYETLKDHGAFREALIVALHLLGHADFKNGNTGPSGLIDEGEVHAGRLMDKIQLLVPQLYTSILEGK